MQHRRHSQPTSPRVIGCALLAYAAYGVWILYKTVTTNPAWRDDQLAAICAVGLPLLSAISGSFILRGANWARILFLAAFIPIYLIFTLSQGGHYFLLYAVIPLILGPSLLSRDANRFFAGRDSFFKPPPGPGPLQLQRQRKEWEDKRSGRYDY
jgi:hypothetical protein